MTNLSALLAGFAMASFLQFGFDDSTVNVGVLVAFGLTTSVVVRPCSSFRKGLASGPMCCPS